MRIIAGRLGGRKLVAPPGAATRPTADRVREALFSVLGDIEGASVLDLFAGTGALGIEAVSRGAMHATFVENGRPALRALRQNLHTLELEGTTTVVPIPVERALKSASWEPESFDLVFADPPYILIQNGRFSGALGVAIDRGLAATLRPGGHVIVEHGSGERAPEVTGITLEQTRVYGDTALSFYLR
ncbi:MAG: 16S rRNA (guanine(966)-N(2))-methyltransferase RsmD [Polyangiaceae bacterium]